MAAKPRTSVQFLIQAVPERLEYVREQLLPFLPGFTRTVVDPGPPPANPWRGYQLCLEHARVINATHFCILQDDVRLCQNFVAATYEIAKANPAVPVVLFLGGLPGRTAGKARQAAKRGRHYVALQPMDFCPVVAMLWPRDKAIEFLHWGREHPQPNARSDDAVAGHWVDRTKQTVLCAIPSLVQHPDETSVVHAKRAKAGDDKGRVALMFCEDDPLLIDWSQSIS